MLRELTLYAADDREAGAFTVGLLYTSQRVRYGLRKAGWIGALLAAAGANTSLFDDFARADRLGLGTAPTGQVWAPAFAGANAGAIVSGRASFAGGDTGNVETATAVGVLPFPFDVSADLVACCYNYGAIYGAATIRVGLNDGWVYEGRVDYPASPAGTATLSLYVGAGRVPQVSVSGPITAPPLTLTGSCDASGASFLGLTLAAPAGIVFTGAADFTLDSEPGSLDPVVFDNVSVEAST
jgi:hypothetical protein